VYYDQRKALVGAQVIVANHDLLLSSWARVLPELDNCLLCWTRRTTRHRARPVRLQRDRAASPGSTGSPAARCASARWWR
jgi:hypothetical protein